MTKEQKQEFTLRITNANKSELTVILCDMFLAYAREAKDALTQWNSGKEFSEMPSELKDSLRRAKACLREMIRSLPQNSDSEEVRSLVGNVLGLYHFAEREIARAQAGRDAEALEHAISVVEGLNRAYSEVSRRDSSPSLMKNTEQIYAGMTYGRNAIHESSNAAANRGYWG